MNLPEATCTVVIPCYNGEADLAAAVESVLGQSFGDFHLVLVDDASTDGTRDVMRRLAGDQPRVSVVEVAKNRGRSHARNLGVEATRGPFVAFLDHDDTYHRDFLRATVTALSESPNLDAIKVLPNISVPVDPVRYEVIFNSLVTTMVIRRAAFDFVGGFPESDVFRTHRGAFEDVAFCELLNYCFHTGLIKQKLYNYTHRVGNCLDRFLARTSVVNGMLRYTAEAVAEDRPALDEVTRLKYTLRGRIRARILESRDRGLERL